MFSFKEELNHFFNKENLAENYLKILQDFFEQYQSYCEKDIFEKNFFNFLKLASKQFKTPHNFEHYHHRITEPFNYYEFGLNFMDPLLERENSVIIGKDAIKEAIEKTQKGENVIFLSNHQIEPDPQIISLLLGKEYADFTKEMIFVAGNRVTDDPLAAIFSLGRNLICIYSKKHIDYPLEEKSKKQSHNQRSMKKMLELLNDGGKSFFIAPSGGRDRAEESGEFSVADFDPQSLEMLFLLKKRAKKACHFYPLAILSYPIMPPPQEIEKKIGEKRNVRRSKAGLYFGSLLDEEKLPQAQDKALQRKTRAEHVQAIVQAQYLELTKQVML